MDDVAKEILNVLTAEAQPYKASKMAPVILEAQYGLTGISTRYHLPAGVNEDMVQGYARRLTHCGLGGSDETKKLSRVFDALAARNPQLETLTFDHDSTVKLYDAICGVASAFNAVDIQFYLDGNYVSKAMENPAYGRLSLMVEDKLGGRHLGWCPAPETLMSIHEQLSTSRMEQKRSCGIAILESTPGAQRVHMKFI